MNARAMPKNEPCRMVSLREITLTGTAGHTITMAAGEPTTVPGPLVDTALARGCVPEDAAEYEAFKNRLVVKAAAEAALKDRLIACIDDMVQRNNIEEFTPTGHPKIPALAALAGITEADLTPQLRDHVFSLWNDRNRAAVMAKKDSEPVAKQDTKKPASTGK